MLPSYRRRAVSGCHACLLVCSQWIPRSRPRNHVYDSTKEVAVRPEASVLGERHDGERPEVECLLDRRRLPGEVAITGNRDVPGSDHSPVEVVTTNRTVARERHGPHGGVERAPVPQRWLRIATAAYRYRISATLGIGTEHDGARHEIGTCHAWLGDAQTARDDISTAVVDHFFA